MEQGDTRIWSSEPGIAWKERANLEAENDKKSKKGLIIVHTGDGKGKTTAALGLAFRALGQGFKVAMIQFIKGLTHYGELESAKQFPNFELIPMGRGFLRAGADEPLAEDVALAHEALQLGREKIHSGQYQIVILDEIGYAMHYKLVALEEVLDLLRAKPKDLHLVLTGRNMPPEVIEMADLVTEMRPIKHPYQQGVKAQKGIEY
ncbi:MAG: cob(I)yrinic acid a,c-diamide adenosyltransferase [Candidatus Tectomicrobia bacterium]|uniref:corrinoid adenosyltransferase n=1 Tax=Tectimicrobiota bacterium TaxID=2528274 RepID=A0A932FZH6_UNCTE|nr:cob(I)yrinic acid a,c-diamide adenosyltransferase [Candidatus Tectomicrobia bacterium]